MQAYFFLYICSMAFFGLPTKQTESFTQFFHACFNQRSLGLGFDGVQHPLWQEDIGPGYGNLTNLPRAFVPVLCLEYASLQYAIFMEIFRDIISIVSIQDMGPRYRNLSNLSRAFVPQQYLGGGLC